jgi:hypothetical protein
VEIWYDSMRYDSFTNYNMGFHTKGTIKYTLYFHILSHSYVRMLIDS